MPASSPQDLSGNQDFDEPSTEAYDVFISHSHADAYFAENLAEQLESEELAEGDSIRNVRVFLDKWDIDPGANIPIRLVEALNRTKCVVCVLTPEFLTSDWAAFEYTSVLAEDPLNRKGQLVGLRVRDQSLDGKQTLSLRAPFSTNNWLDFRTESGFEAGVVRLIRFLRGEPAKRGFKRSPLAGNALLRRRPVSGDGYSTSPDLNTEILVSNLLPIISRPEGVWTAFTKLRYHKEVPKGVGQLPPFILRDGKLISFSQIKGTELEQLCESESQTYIEARGFGTDLKIERYFTELIGRSVKSFLRSRELKLMGRDRYVFRLGRDGSEVRIQSGKNQIRKVNKLAKGADGSTFWVHQAAFITTARIECTNYLKIDPTYCFSLDGNNAIAGKASTRLSLQWLGKQQNIQLLRDLVFWANWLGGGNVVFDIPTGGVPLQVAASPAQSESKIGIRGDSVKIGALVDQGTFTVDQIAQRAESNSEAQEAETGDSDES